MAPWKRIRWRQCLSWCYRSLHSWPSNSTATQLSVTPTPFRPRPSAVRVSIYWSLSLILSHFAAFGAMLVQEWIRNFRRHVYMEWTWKTPSCAKQGTKNPHDVIRRGLNILSASHLIHPILRWIFWVSDYKNDTVAYASLSLFIFGGLVYLWFTLDPNSPYVTPLTNVILSYSFAEILNLRWFLIIRNQYSGWSTRFTMTHFKLLLTPSLLILLKISGARYSCTTTCRLFCVIKSSSLSGAVRADCLKDDVKEW